MSPLHGVRQFIEGARTACSSQLARYSWAPALSSAIIIGLGLALASSYIGEFSTWLVAQLPDWLGFLERILTPLLYVFGLLFGAWMFGFLAVIIAGPFLGNLSRKVEVLELGESPDDTRSFLEGLVAGIGREARKLGYYLPRLFLVLLITLIPVINIIAPIIWFGFGAWIMAVQFCDYPTENRNLPFSDTITRLRRHRGAALGFGGCTTLLLAIPLVNFLVIPIAVAGGTLLWHSLEDT
ncbi:MAG: sulfate transporter CysZ [Gammaproteobacteria bacterium]|nr:sulfate transporter CysZ [Gammaproteobacteria bacterium]